MSFAYKGTFTVTSNSSLLPSTQTNIPVLVSVTDNSLKTVGNGGSVQNTVSFNGQTVPADVVFKLASDLSGAAMTYDVESYDATAGTLVVWVLKATLALGDLFYCGIGDVSISTYQGGSVGAVWDSNYNPVFHLANGTTLSLEDSTANNNDATNHNTVAAATGQIDGGGQFLNASARYLTTADSGDYDASSLTLEAWFKTSATGIDQGLINRDDVGTNRSFQFKVDSSNHLQGVFAGDTHFFILVSSGTYTDGNWHKGAFVITYNGAGSFTCKLYADNVEVATETFIDVPAIDKTLGISIGIVVDGGGGGDGFSGTIDEPRFSKVARSVNWLTAMYSNESAPSTFVSSSFASTSSAPTHVGSMLTMFQ